MNIYSVVMMNNKVFWWK